jgi:GrpB-like predicted nucleotidyltransferase (UPF0157 family)
MFGEESTRIPRAAGSNCIAVHHVGSTSIPGLHAKPIIDIIAVFQNPRGAISHLELIGYTYKGEYNIPMHYGFSKKYPFEINLHAYG